MQVRRDRLVSWSVAYRWPAPGSPALNEAASSEVWQRLASLPVGSLRVGTGVAAVGTAVVPAALVGTGADPVAGSADPTVVPPPRVQPATASSAAAATMIRIFTAYPLRPRIVVHRVRCRPAGSGCRPPPAGQALDPPRPCTYTRSLPAAGNSCPVGGDLARARFRPSA